MENKVLCENFYEVVRDWNNDIIIKLNEKGKKEMGINGTETPRGEFGSDRVCFEPDTKKYIDRERKGQDCMGNNFGENIHDLCITYDSELRRKMGIFKEISVKRYPRYKIKGKGMIIKQVIYSERFIFISGDSVEDYLNGEKIGEISVYNDSDGFFSYIKTNHFLLIYDTLKQELSRRLFHSDQEEGFSVTPSLCGREVIIRCHFIHLYRFFENKGWTWIHKSVDNSTERDVKKQIIFFGKERHVQAYFEDFKMKVRFYQSSGEDLISFEGKDYDVGRRRTFYFVADKNFLYVFYAPDAGGNDANPSSISRRIEVFDKIDVKKVFTNGNLSSSNSSKKFFKARCVKNLIERGSKVKRYLNLISSIEKKRSGNKDNIILNIQITRDGYVSTNITSPKENKRLYVYDFVYEKLFFFCEETSCGYISVKRSYAYISAGEPKKISIIRNDPKGFDREDKEKYISMMLEGIKEKDIF